MIFPAMELFLVIYHICTNEHTCSYNPFQGSHRNIKTQFHNFSMIFHDQRCYFHDYLTTSSQKTCHRTLVVSSKYFTKFHDFFMIIQVFSESMIFPCKELFLVIFQVSHDFQNLWEPCLSLSFMNLHAKSINYE